MCQPVCQDLDEQSVSLKDIQAARNKRRKDLQNEIDQRLSLVDAILSSKSRIITKKLSEKPVKPTKLNLYAADEWIYCN